MVVYRREEGFTVVEMIVTLVIVSLFLGVFFQTFFTSQDQQATVSRMAAATNIVQANLNKITEKNYIPDTTTECLDTPSSPNNPLTNASAQGSIIATNATTGQTTPTWADAGMTSELLDNTNLANDTTVQTLKILYPQGCDDHLPAQVISIVTYITENGSQETVTHAAYIN